MTKLTPKHGYILRGFHEWLEDNELTPYLMINATAADVVVPQQLAQNSQLVLCISYNATKDLFIGNDHIAFSARFGGVSEDIWIPMNAVLALYAKEIPEQIIPLSPDEYNALAQPTKTQPTKTQPTKTQQKTKISHLKIIK